MGVVRNNRITSTEAAAPQADAAQYRFNNTRNSPAERNPTAMAALPPATSIRTDPNAAPNTKRDFPKLIKTRETRKRSAAQPETETGLTRELRRLLSKIVGEMKMACKIGITDKKTKAQKLTTRML